MKTESEKKETAETFLSELKELAKKYDAIHLSVCCELEGKFFGVVATDLNDFGDFFEASLYVGRLYQSCREKVKRIMDDCETAKFE